MHCEDMCILCYERCVSYAMLCTYVRCATELEVIPEETVSGVLKVLDLRSGSILLLDSDPTMNVPDLIEPQNHVRVAFKQRQYHVRATS
jgi:hypothetical protein